MKSFNEFKQQISESITPEQQRLDVLVRAGLLDKTLLPQLHRIMDKLSQDKQLTSQERLVVFDMVKELTQLVTANFSVFQKVRQALKEESVAEASDSSSVAMYHQEPPPLLVLRRKAIRMYPHDTRVALYYSDKLDRYFTVPYQDAENQK